MFDFTDKVIVVTGAAGGLGSAVVQKFFTANGVVCALDHRKGRVPALIDTSEGHGKLFTFDEVDLTDRAATVSLVEKVHSEVGLVDVIVNTVGGFTSGERVHELSPNTFQKMMDLNVQSFLNITTAFVPDLLQKSRGKVISVGSRASLKGGAKSGAYAAAKGALLRLTESMAEELKTDNVQVNCVLPGTIDTADNREAIPNADFSKWVAPGKIADVILFLSSPASDVTTGAAIPVYGRS